MLRMRELVRQVPVASHVKEYIARVTLATHPGSDDAPDTVKRYVRYGASPRGAQAVTLCAKVRALINNVSFDDVAAAVRPALRHRIIFNFEGEAEGIAADRIIADVVAAVKHK